MTETNSEHGSDDTDILLDALNPLIAQSEKLFAESGIITFASSQHNDNSCSNSLQTSGTSVQLTATKNNHSFHNSSRPPGSAELSDRRPDSLASLRLSLGRSSDSHHSPTSSTVPDIIDSTAIVQPLLEAQRLHRQMTVTTTTPQQKLSQPPPSSSEEATPRAAAAGGGGGDSSSRSSWSDPPHSDRSSRYKSSPRATVTMYSTAETRHPDLLKASSSQLRLSRENIALHSNQAHNQLRRRSQSSEKPATTTSATAAAPANDGSMTQRSILSDVLERVKPQCQQLSNRGDVVGHLAESCVVGGGGGYHHLYRQSEFGTRILERAQNNVEAAMTCKSASYEEHLQHSAPHLPSSTPPINTSTESSPRRMTPLVTNDNSTPLVAGEGDRAAVATGGSRGGNTVYRDQSARMVSTLNSTIDALRKEVDRERSHASSLEGTLRDLREQLGGKDVDLCQLRDDVERRCQALSELDTTMARMASSWQHRETELLSEKGEVEARVVGILVEVERLQGDLETSQREKEALQAVVKQEKDRFSQSTSKLLQERGVLCSNLDDLTAQLNSSAEHLSETRSALSATCDRLEEANLARDTAQQEGEEMRLALTESCRRVESMERSVEGRRQDSEDWSLHVEGLEGAVTRAEEEARRWRTRAEELVRVQEVSVGEREREMVEMTSGWTRTEADIKARCQQQLATARADHESERGRLEANLREAHRIQIRELNRRHTGELARMRERAESEIAARMVEAETRVRELEIRARRAEDRMDAWRRDKCAADAQQLEKTLSQIGTPRSHEASPRTPPICLKKDTTPSASISQQQGSLVVPPPPLPPSFTGEDLRYSPLSVISEKTETGVVSPVLDVPNHHRQCHQDDHHQDRQYQHQDRQYQQQDRQYHKDDQHKDRQYQHQDDQHKDRQYHHDYHHQDRPYHQDDQHKDRQYHQDDQHQDRQHHQDDHHQDRQYNQDDHHKDDQHQDRQYHQEDHHQYQHQSHQQETKKGGDGALVIEVSPDFSGFFSSHHFDRRTPAK